MIGHLYLVRHATAFPRDGERWPEDSERPLTREGVKYFRRVVLGVAHLPPPDAVCSSPWLRAWQTGDLLTEAGWPAPQVLAPLAPGGDPREVVSALPSAERVALVGHAPDLSRLASFLLTGDADLVSIEIKKGGVVALDWDQVLGRATLKWHVAPGLLRRLS